MPRNIYTAIVYTPIVAVSAVASLALVSTGASAQSMSVLPTFHPATIQMPRTNNQPSYGPTYSYPSVKWGCRAVGRDNHYGWSTNYATRPQAMERALGECSARTTNCRIVSCAASN